MDPRATPRPRSSTGPRSAAAFIVLCALGTAFGWQASLALGDAAAGAHGPAAVCDCAEDYRAPGLVKTDLERAWVHAFDGERPDDRDLAAYQDAVEILGCLATSGAVAPVPIQPGS